MPNKVLVEFSKHIYLTHYTLTCPFKIFSYDLLCYCYVIAGYISCSVFSQIIFILEFYYYFFLKR